jgi:polar amino acid transport system substrate-binding protein
MICLLCIFWSYSIINVHAIDLEIVAEDFPPYEYKENGKVTGFTVELIEVLLTKTGYKGKTKILPWARAYQIALTKKNVLIHTVARKKERENLFKWIGPISPRIIYFYKLKKRTDIQVNTLEDAKNYKIGVVRGQAVRDLLIANSFEERKNIFTVTGDDQNIEKLFLERIELIDNTDFMLRWRLKRLGLDYGKVEKVFVVDDSTDYYMAFSKKTSDEIVNQFRKAFKTIKQDGIIKKLEEKYF